MVAVKDAQLEFTHGEMRFVERASANGTFSASVSPGEYTLNVTAKGYCPNTRKVVITEKNPTDSLSLNLMDCSDCSTMIIDFAEPPIEPDAPPPKAADPQSLVFKYRDEPLEGGNATGLKPLLLYGRRTDLGNFIEYTGLDCPGNDKLAILQYDGGSLKASKITLEKQAHAIRGEGEVTVVDGRGVSRGSMVEVNLLAEVPHAVIIK